MSFSESQTPELEYKTASIRQHPWQLQSQIANVHFFSRGAVPDGACRLSSTHPARSPARPKAPPDLPRQPPQGRLFKRQLHTPSYGPLEPVYGPFYGPFYGPIHSCQHLATSVLEIKKILFLIITAYMHQMLAGVDWAIEWAREWAIEWAIYGL